MASLDAILRVTARGEGFSQVAAGIRSIGKAGDEASRAVGGIGRMLGSVTGGLVAMGAGLSAAGVAAFAKNAIDAADNLRDMSQRTGVSVEMLSKFGQAANMAGTNIDGVGSAMVKLSRGLAEAAATGKGPAAEAMRTLGISAVDASGQLRTADQVMLQVADKFRQLPDGAQKAALAVQLFGKAGAEMIPMLNEGRQAIEGLDATMTTAFAGKADAYNDSLAAMGAVFGQIGMAIADQLLPHLSSAVDWLTRVGIGFRDWIVANKEPIRQTIETIGQVGKALAPWVAGLFALVGAYKVLSSAVKAAAVAQAALMALTGPRGWGILLGAAAAATVAVVALNKATAAAGDATAGAEVEARKLAAGYDRAAQAAEGMAAPIDQAAAATEAAKQRAAELKAQQEAFNAAIEQSNASYALLKSTIDATGQALQLQGQLRQETFNADIAVNNAAKSILESKLAQAKTDADKIPILRQIMGLELENARIQREATSEQIRQEVTLTDLKRQKAWQELRSAQNALATAAAYGQQTEQLQTQVNLLKVAANSADLELKMQQKIAEQKERANQANYKAAQAVITNNRQAPAVSQSAPAAQGKPMGYINGKPYYSQQFMPYGGLPQMAAGAYVSGATKAVVGEAGPEYVIPAARMASASKAYLQGSRGIDVVNGKAPGGPGGGAVAINIQTGPVMRQGGQDWVTVSDLEAALDQTASALMRSMRTPGARLAMGG